MNIIPPPASTTQLCSVQNIIIIIPYNIYSSYWLRMYAMNLFKIYSIVDNYQ